MDHRDHVRLIADGVQGYESGRWADLGSGTGAFTLAIADLLRPGGSIVSVDRDAAALAEQRRAMFARFPDVPIEAIAADFTRPVSVGTLDGILMANSLHFVSDKVGVLRPLLAHLRPGGRFVLVEYDSDHGNRWVPWPMSYGTWQRLAAEAGLVGTRPLDRVPSRFLDAIYSTASDTPSGT